MAGEHTLTRKERRRRDAYAASVSADISRFAEARAKLDEDRAAVLDETDRLATQGREHARSLDQLLEERSAELEAAAQAEAALADARAELARISERSESSERAHADLQARIQSAHEQLRVDTVELERVRAELASLDTTAPATSELEEQLTEAQEALRVVTAELEAERATAAERRADADEVNARQSELDDELRSVTAARLELASQLAELREASSSDGIRHARAHVIATEQELAQQRAALAATEQACADLTAQAAKIEQRHEELATAATQLHEQLAAVKERRSQADQALAELREQVRPLALEESRLREQVERTREELAEATSRHAATTAEVEAARAKLAQTAARIEELEADETLTAGELTERSQACEGLAADLAKLSERLDEEVAKVTELVSLAVSAQDVALKTHRLAGMSGHISDVVSVVELMGIELRALDLVGAEHGSSATDTADTLVGSALLSVRDALLDAAALAAPLADGTPEPEAEADTTPDVDPCGQDSESVTPALAAPVEVSGPPAGAPSPVSPLRAVSETPVAASAPDEVFPEPTDIGHHLAAVVATDQLRARDVQQGPFAAAGPVDDLLGVDDSELFSEHSTTPQAGPPLDAALPPQSEPAPVQVPTHGQPLFSAPEPEATPAEASTDEEPDLDMSVLMGDDGADDFAVATSFE